MSKKYWDMKKPSRDRRILEIYLQRDFPWDYALTRKDLRELPQHAIDKLQRCDTL